jgi:hypothetical protein
LFLGWWGCLLFSTHKKLHKVKEKKNKKKRKMISKKQQEEEREKRISYFKVAKLKKLKI